MRLFKRDGSGGVGPRGPLENGSGGKMTSEVQEGARPCYGPPKKTDKSEKSTNGAKGLWGHWLSFGASAAVESCKSAIWNRNVAVQTFQKRKRKKISNQWQVSATAKM